MTANPFVILYVEDNASIRESFAEILSAPERRIVCVADGAGARAALREQDVSLLMTDIELPDGSGLEVAEWMRTVAPLARVPVVVVSADSTQAQRDAATVAGVRAYLAKPVRLRETLLLIDELLPAAK